MPFTISHAAAVLPLRRFTRRTLPLAALMIGSMSPDFSYFLPGEWSQIPTHTFAGLFWFCWPVGLAVWLVFVQVLEAPTRALLPEPWRSRIAASNARITFPTLALASAAVVIGAVTHLTWDAFTHRYTPVTEAMPWLRVVVFKIGYVPIRLYKVLQHLSSIFGLAVLIVWAWRQRRAPQITTSDPPHYPAYANPQRARWVAMLIVAASACALALLYYFLYDGVYFERRLFHLAIGGMLGGAIAWLAVALALRGRNGATSAGTDVDRSG
jgi:uncharacterized protein DUF4184